MHICPRSGKADSVTVEAHIVVQCTDDKVSTIARLRPQIPGFRCTNNCRFYYKPEGARPVTSLGETDTVPDWKPTRLAVRYAFLICTNTALVVSAVNRADASLHSQLRERVLSALFCLALAHKSGGRNAALAFFEDLRLIWRVKIGERTQARASLLPDLVEQHLSSDLTDVSSLASSSPRAVKFNAETIARMLAAHKLRFTWVAVPVFGDDLDLTVAVAPVESAEAKTSKADVTSKTSKTDSTSKNDKDQDESASKKRQRDSVAEQSLGESNSKKSKNECKEDSFFDALPPSPWHGPQDEWYEWTAPGDVVVLLIKRADHSLAFAQLEEIVPPLRQPDKPPSRQPDKPQALVTWFTKPCMVRKDGTERLSMNIDLQSGAKHELVASSCVLAWANGHKPATLKEFNDLKTWLRASRRRQGR